MTEKTPATPLPPSTCNPAPAPRLREGQAAAGGGQPDSRGRTAPPAGLARIPPPGKDARGKARTRASAADDTGNLGMVVRRNEFYRDCYYSILKVTIIQSVIIIGLIAAMTYLIRVHQPQNRYFPMTVDGRPLPMLALTEPNLSTPALMSWAAQAATEVMTFGFSDYRRRLQESSRDFTRRGWETFTQALQKSRIMETVQQNHQVITAAPQGAPLLLSEGVVNGRYQWMVQLPLVLTYQFESHTRTDALLMTLVVVRQPRLDSPDGVGIEQWIAVPR